MNASARIAALRMRLEDADIPAMLVSMPTNVAYLTGFDSVFDEEAAHAVVVTQDALSIYTDGRYAEAVRQAASGTEWQVFVPDDNLYGSVCSGMAASGVDSIAIEESVPHGRFRFFSRAFEGHVEAVDQWVEEIRQVKDASEIQRIQAAQEITDAAYAHLLGFVSAGMTERDVALEIEVFMRRNGSEGVAFAPIVASGPNSALPHARPTDREIAKGDLIVIDFGARVGGYCADMTRTIVMGAAGDRQREVHAAVLAANEAGRAGVAPGRKGVDIDAGARAVLDAAGLGEAFVHGLGHGVGLQVHELPHVGKRGLKSVLAGSVITIEPGAYEPGFGGVRIEDLVVVEPEGARVLSGSSRDLVEL